MAIPALEIVLQELEGSDLNMIENSLAVNLSGFVRERFKSIGLDKFYWIANSLDPRFCSKTFENDDYMNALKHALKIVLVLNNIKRTQNESRELTTKESDLQYSKGRKSLFPVKRYSESQTQLYSEDIIDMELTLFKAEARTINGIIEVDPIKWWVRNSNKLLLMSKLAMVYLLSPASTGDVERLFSVACRICRPRRSRLSPETIELLVTLKYRMLSEKNYSQVEKDSTEVCDGILKKNLP